MFFSLSKIIDFLLLPICWILFFLIFAYFQKDLKKVKIGILSTLFLLILFTNGFFTNLLYSNWELEKPKNLPKGVYIWGIVLGGGIIRNTGQITEDYTFAESSDRLMQTILLHKKGIIKKILITGGNTTIGVLMKDMAKESYQSKQFMIQMGVPSKDIFIEEFAKNTFENAVNSKLALRKYIKSDSMLVITSAYHSRRAKACFEKQGFRFSIYPVDQLRKDGNTGLLHQIVPEEKNLYLCSKIIREITGFIIYKIMGYC
ncbi:YdcF family protein [Aquirufa sp. ROCK-SH2]